MDLEAISNFIQAGLIDPIDQVQVSPSAERLLWTPMRSVAVQKVLNSSDYTLYILSKTILRSTMRSAIGILTCSWTEPADHADECAHFVAATVPIEKLSDNALCRSSIVSSVKKS